MPTIHGVHPHPDGMPGAVPPERLIHDPDLAPEGALLERPIGERAEHMAWTDLDGVVHYDSIVTARARLMRIALDHVHLAKAALRDGDIDGAERAAAVAAAAMPEHHEGPSLVDLVRAHRGHGPPE